MKKIILSLICLLAVCVCAGAACATNDVDNMAIDDSAVPHDTFVSMDMDHNPVSSSNQNAGDLDNSIAGDDLVKFDPVRSNLDDDSGIVLNDNMDGNCSVDLTVDDIMNDVFISVPVEMDLDVPVADNSIAGDDLVNVDLVSVTNDNSAIDLEDTYFQSVKWIIPAEYLNPCINFTIPELSPTVSDITDNSVNTIIRVEKNIRLGVSMVILAIFNYNI